MTEAAASAYLAHREAMGKIQAEASKETRRPRPLKTEEYQHHVAWHLRRRLYWSADMGFLRQQRIEHRRAEIARQILEMKAKHAIDNVGAVEGPYSR